jgi:hypothetical protein
VFGNVVVVVVAVLIPCDSRMFLVVCVVAVVASGAVVSRNTAHTIGCRSASAIAVVVRVVA